MLKEERQQAILTVLMREGKVVAGELCQRFGVSEDTIRRDLRDLDQAGKMQRVHGGALPHSPAEASYEKRLSMETGAKEAIARAALKLIQDGQVILLDGGTTTLLIARMLPPTLKATIVTNNLPAAEVLTDHPGVKVILLGGQLFSSSRVTIGSMTIEALQRIRADLCLLGVCSLHPDVGLSVQDMEEGSVKRTMIARSQEVAAPITKDKLGRASAFVVAPLTSLTYLVPDPDIPAESLESYRNAGISLIY